MTAPLDLDAIRASLTYAEATPMTTVLALCDALAAARAEVARLRARVGMNPQVERELMDDIATLRRQLAAWPATVEAHETLIARQDAELARLRPVVAAAVAWDAYWNRNVTMSSEEYLAIEPRLTAAVAAFVASAPKEEL
jgi:hypothetical protein